MIFDSINSLMLEFSIFLVPVIIIGIGLIILIYKILKTKVGKIVFAIFLILIALFLIYILLAADDYIYDDDYYNSDIEKNAFNSQFDVYERFQTSSNVSSLLARVKVIAKEKWDDKDHVPSVYFFNYIDSNQNGIDFDSCISYENVKDADEYVEKILEIKEEKVIGKTLYYVITPINEENGIIDKIIIVAVPKTDNDMSQSEISERLEKYIDNYMENNLIKDK